MKKIFRIVVLVVIGAPLLAVFLIALLVFLANRFVPSDHDLQSALAEHASTKAETVAWLQATHRRFAESPVTGDSVPPLGTSDELEGASSVIDVSFQTRGEVPEMFYGTHHLRCWIFFNDQGRLVRSKFQSMYFGP